MAVWTKPVLGLALLALLTAGASAQARRTGDVVGGVKIVTEDEAASTIQKQVDALRAEAERLRKMVEDLRVDGRSAEASELSTKLDILREHVERLDAVSADVRKAREVHATPAKIKATFGELVEDLEIHGVDGKTLRVKTLTEKPVVKEERVVLVQEGDGPVRVIEGPAAGGLFVAPAKAAGHGYLGIRMGDAADGGVKIIGVLDSSPAQVAGVKAGDVLHALNDKPVKGVSQLMDRLQKTRPGMPVKLHLKRGGYDVLLILQLGARPATMESEALKAATAPRVVLPNPRVTTPFPLYRPDAASGAVAEAKKAVAKHAAQLADLKAAAAKAIQTGRYEHAAELSRKAAAVAHQITAVKKKLAELQAKATKSLYRKVKQPTSFTLAGGASAGLQPIQRRMAAMEKRLADMDKRLARMEMMLKKLLR